MTRKTVLILSVAAIALAAGAPALAQKTNDTLRYPIPEAHTAADTYLLPGRVSQMWDPSIYDNLFGYDPKARKFTPQLVKSWTQPNPTTYELTLRDDIKFHDGEKFDADDAVHTLKYLIDPTVKLRFKKAWAFIKSVEKLGPYKLRFTTDGPAPDAIMQLAFGSPMYPEHIHAKLKNKEEFGEKPIGTGPYKIVQLDKNNGTIAVKNPYFKGYPTKKPAAIGRVISEPIPDMGTLTAKLMAGQADIVRDLPIQQAFEMQKTGRFKVTLSPLRTAYNFLQFPSAAWKNVKALGDVRVRKAIMMAIDRKTLIKQEYGPLVDEVPPLEGLCKKEQIGCGYTAELVPAYDPAGAKKLLAEAGYAGGFDVTISCYNDNVGQATAVAGMLRDIGIRATVKEIASRNRRKFVLGGQVEIGYLGWSGGGTFTVGPNIVRLFLTKEHDDPKLIELGQPVMEIMDDAKRREAATKVFDYYTRQAYGFPIHHNQETFTHSIDLALRDPDEMRPSSIHPHEFYWK